jgi:hypothetical protein
MSVDRDQIRRDAELTLNVGGEGEWLPYEETWHGLATACLVLLAELEQAEEKLDFGMDASQVATLVLRHREAETRLTKVPALVEALTEIGAIQGDEPFQYTSRRIARAALEAWEHE